MRGRRNPPDGVPGSACGFADCWGRPAACWWPSARASGLALAGFLLIGIGVSVVIPLVFAAAGNSGPSAALGVAGVATISYGAGLCAPSAMGGIADVSSLRVAFAVAAVLASTIAVGAGLLQRPARAEPDAEPDSGRGGQKKISLTAEITPMSTTKMRSASGGSRRPNLAPMKPPPVEPTAISSTASQATCAKMM